MSCMMAGIPFNKIHELEFAPGEVRLNQDMANVQKFYEARQQELALNRDYEKTIQLGKVELERLRRLDPATIVSKKDQKIEMEAAAIEKQQRQQDEQKRIKSEKEEEARLLRRKKIEEARIEKQQAAALQRMSHSGSSEAGEKTTRIAFGSLTSLALAAALATAGQSETTDPVTVSSRSAAMRNETITGPLNATISSLQTRSMAYSILATKSPNAETPASGSDSAALQDVEETSGGMPDTLSQVTLSGGDAASSNTKSLYSDPVPTLEKKKEAAEKAMEEYLDQDDGGDDWLTVMGQLMEEEDDEDKNELDTENGWQ